MHDSFDYRYSHIGSLETLKIMDFMFSWFLNANLAPSLFCAIIGAILGGYIALYLTNRKEKKDAQVRFRNRLLSVAYELKYNYRFVGNSQNPFQTKALEKLFYDEPLIHQYPELFQKTQQCINTALILSTSIQHPQLRAADGQNLMKELTEHLKNFHSIETK